MIKHRAIGIMSGTSVDGIDIAHCVFKKEKKWSYKIEKAITINYPKGLKNRLLEAQKLNGYELIQLDHNLGDFIGKETKGFINKHNLKPEIISCHGHTIFHNLKDKISYQIGNANRIYSIVKIPVINNYRELDVIFEGQGAPLVPIGEKLLFHGHNYFINIGGILNLTKIDNNKIIAYDVVPANIVLNNISNKLEYEYDDKGNIAKKGKLIPELFKKLNSINYYKKNYPKSIGFEWIEKNIFRLIYKSRYKTMDILNTFTNHIAFQLTNNIKGQGNKIFITGGGAYNDYLIKKVKSYDKNKNDWKIPNDNLVNYKEALIFAFIGLLKQINKKNILKSVTGSSENISSGTITENLIN